MHSIAVCSIVCELSSRYMNVNRQSGDEVKKYVNWTKLDWFCKLAWQHRLVAEFNYELCVILLSLFFCMCFIHNCAGMIIVLKCIGLLQLNCLVQYNDAIVLNVAIIVVVVSCFQSFLFHCHCWLDTILLWQLPHRTVARPEH